jgi:hypothetical protein
MAPRDDQAQFYVRTLGGKIINYFSPDWRQIDFRDAGHNLSRIVRYTGGMPDGCDYTILDHQLVVAGTVKRMGGSRRAQAWAAIHDVPEAWTNDIPSPLKAAIRVHSTTLDIIEANLEEALLIAAGLEGLTRYERDVVKAADEVAGEVEHRKFRVERTAWKWSNVKNESKVELWLNELRGLGVNVDFPGVRFIDGEDLDGVPNAA